MFTWLKSLFPKPKRIEDPVFGALIYADGYWEGRGQFEPTKERIEWFVFAGEAGPSEPQYRSFAAICGRYAELRVKADAAIRAVVPSVATDGLKLSAIDVLADLNTSTWELSFAREGPEGWHYVVEFLGLEPSGNVEVSR